MNVLLEKKLEIYDFSDKDKYEIRQIFEFATDEKKRSILANFDKIANNVLKIKQELKYNQEILLGRAISNIEKAILTAKKSWIKSLTWEWISDLKKIF